MANWNSNLTPRTTLSLSRESRSYTLSEMNLTRCTFRSAAPTPKYLIRRKRRLSFKPLRAASAEIWTYILRLVMASDSPSHTHTANERNLHVLLTCKDFFVSHPVRYFAPITDHIRSVSDFQNFCEAC